MLGATHACANPSPRYGITHGVAIAATVAVVPWNQADRYADLSPALADRVEHLAERPADGSLLLVRKPIWNRWLKMRLAVDRPLQSPSARRRPAEIYRCAY
jgi:hypothetical protein